MPNITHQELSVIAVDNFVSFGLSMLGLLGNMLVACAFFQLKLSTTNFFILNLALLDILTCLCVMLKQVNSFIGEISNHACPLLQYLLYFSTSAPPFLILAIAFDRYGKLRRIDGWQPSLKHAKIVVAVTTLISIILSLPILFFYKLRNFHQNERKCEIQLKNIYPFIYFVVLFVLLLSIVIPIIFCYKEVYRIIKTIKYKQPKNAEKLKRSTMTMSCIAVVFIFSYLPCLLVDVLDQKFTWSPHGVVQIFHCLATKSYVFSCMLNPFIYGWKDQRSWSAIKMLFQSRPVVSWTVPEPYSVSSSGRGIQTDVHEHADY